MCSVFGSNGRSEPNRCSFEIPRLGGTFVFAISGGVAAVNRRLDIFSILVLSFVAGNVGGITRDLLIGAVPPAALTDEWYLLVSVVAGHVGHQHIFEHRALFVVLRLKRPAKMAGREHDGSIVRPSCLRQENISFSSLPAREASISLRNGRAACGRRQRETPRRRLQDVWCWTVVCPRPCHADISLPALWHDKVAAMAFLVAYLISA